MAQNNSIQLNKTDKGVYSCKIPITAEQWIELLGDTSIISPEWKKVLYSFYFMLQHKATCTQCAEKYGYTKNTYNSGISALGRAVIKRLGTFSIVDEDGEARYWPVPIGIGKDIKINGSWQFEWQLRDELTAALQSHLLDSVITQYISDIDKYWQDEVYKWKAVQWFQNHWDIDDTDFPSMLEFATGKAGNLLATQSMYPRDMIIKLAKSSPEEVRMMFRNLYDESQDLSKRVQDFIDKAEDIRQRFNHGKNHYQNTNAVSTYLWLRFPEKYYIYKYGEYKQVGCSV